MNLAALIEVFQKTPDIKAVYVNQEGYQSLLKDSDGFLDAMERSLHIGNVPIYIVNGNNHPFVVIYTAHGVQYIQETKL